MGHCDHDLRKDGPAAAIDEEIRATHLSSVSAFFTPLDFRCGLLRAAYTRPALESVVVRSRFGRGQILPDGRFRAQAGEVIELVAGCSCIRPATSSYERSRSAWWYTTVVSISSSAAVRSYSSPSPRSTVSGLPMTWSA